MEIFFWIMLILITSPIWAFLLWLIFAIVVFFITPFIAPKTTEKEKEELRTYKNAKARYGWTDKIGNFYISDNLNEILLDEKRSWALIPFNEIVACSTTQESYHGAGGEDVLAKAGIVVTTRSNAQYELLTFDGKARRDETLKYIRRNKEKMLEIKRRSNLI